MKSVQFFLLLAQLTVAATASSVRDSHLPSSRERHATPRSNADIVKSFFDRMATRTTTTMTTTTTTIASALRLHKTHHMRRHHHEKADEPKPPVKVEMPHRRSAEEVEHFPKAETSHLQVEAAWLPSGWRHSERPRSNAELLRDYFDRMATTTSTTTSTTTEKAQKPATMHHVRLHRHVAKKDTPPAVVESPHARFAKEFEKFTKAHGSSAKGGEGHRQDSTSSTTTTSTTTSHQEYQFPHGHPLRIVPHRNSAN